MGSLVRFVDLTMSKLFHSPDKSFGTFRMPSVAGEYVLRWYTRNDPKMLAERLITLTPIDISIIAPSEAINGTVIEVAWCSGQVILATYLE